VDAAVCCAQVAEGWSCRECEAFYLSEAEADECCAKDLATESAEEATP
jgi:hypothetical protein